MKDKFQAELVAAVATYARHASELCEVAGTGNPVEFAEAKRQCERDVERIEEIRGELQESTLPLPAIKH